MSAGLYLCLRGASSNPTVNHIDASARRNFLPIQSEGGPDRTVTGPIYNMINNQNKPANRCNCAVKYDNTIGDTPINGQ